MARQIRKTHPYVEELALAVNDIKAQIGAGSSFHLDKSENTVTADDATDLETALTLCNQLIAVYQFHFADTLAHKVADATALPDLGEAIDLATAITAANELKTAHGAHIGDTTEHYNADATNTIAAANASDQGTLETLLNELKSDLNAHMASGPAAKSIRAMPA